MAAMSALDGGDGFRHGHSVLLGLPVSSLIQALRVYLPLSFRRLSLKKLSSCSFAGWMWRVLAASGPCVLRPRLCGSAGRTDSWSLGTAGEPCLAAASAFAQCDYIHMLKFTHTWA